MSKKKKESEQQVRASGPSVEARQLNELIAAGDNRSARARARGLLAEPSTSDADRALVSDVLARTGYDRGALFAGLAALAAVAAALLKLYVF
jgi:hypothetical protein